jgi:virginiamycin B lyase
MSLRPIVSTLWVATLVACGGQSVLAPPNANGGSTPNGVAGGQGRLVLHIHVPKRHRHRRSHYISPSTKGITVAITGPSNVDQTVSLQPNAPGCSTTPAGTSCTLVIPGLKACTSSGNCYSASIATYDAISGCPSACSIAGAHELSANQNVPFSIARGRSNSIGITLDGIPATVAFVPGAGSSLSGSVGSGFTLSKCGSDNVSVFGVDADGNDILGAGAPVPSLVSDSAHLTVSTPAPAAPNQFTIVRPSPPPNAHSTVHLTAGVTPLAGASLAPEVSTAPITMTFNGDICGVITEFTLVNSPNFITSGPDGNIWFDEYSPAKVGQMTTTGSLLNEFSVPTITGLTFITVGPDNEVWFAANGAVFVPGTHGVGKVTTGGTVTAYPVPTPVSNPTPGPLGITAGPDGNLWFTECQAHDIVQETTAGVILAAYTTGGLPPYSITAGPDGALWFTEGGEIGTITTGGSITNFTSGVHAINANDIVTGPDGKLWFTEPNANAIGTITTSGTFSEYSIPTTSGFPVAIVSGPDGALWFTETSGHRIGRITTAGAVTKEYFLSTIQNNDIVNITLGSDGALWFVETMSKRIGRLQ